MTHAPDSPDGETPEAAAARWDARLRSPNCTAVDQTLFKAWITQDPRHLASYARLQATLRLVRGSYPGAPELRALRDKAVAHTLRRRSQGLAAAAALLLAVGGAAAYVSDWSRTAPARPAEYSTGAGDSSTLRLADGTVVTLNAKSRLVVDYSRNRRGVSLMEGQAYFNVAQDKTRPFEVVAGGRSITALGTAFDVKLARTRIEVTMVEGTTALGPSGAWSGPPERLRLTAGQYLVGPTTQAGARVSQRDPSLATSWRAGKVIFEDQRLSDALEEMSRYDSRPMRLADPQLGEVRISGVFHTGRTESFLSALEMYFSLRTRVASDGAVVISAAKGS